jgi:hypothetical protein
MTPSSAGLGREAGALIAVTLLLLSNAVGAAGPVGPVLPPHSDGMDYSASDRLNRRLAVMPAPQRDAVAEALQVRAAVLEGSAEAKEREARVEQAKGNEKLANFLRTVSAEISEAGRAATEAADVATGMATTVSNPDLALEQVVQTTNPMLPTCNGDVPFRGNSEAGYWQSSLNSFLASHSKKLSSVGRIEVTTQEDKLIGGRWRKVPVSRPIGTAFYVGGSTAITAFHVVDKRFDEASGVIRVDAPMQINFGGEYKCASTTAAPLVKVRRVNEKSIAAQDIAVLEVDEPAGIEQFTVASPAYRPQLLDAVVVVGYPSMDKRVPRDLLLYMLSTGPNGQNPQPDIRRWQPGEIIDPDRCPSISTKTQIGHDATTVGNNSGSPIIDMKSGVVIGIQTSGMQGICNYATLASLFAPNL